MNPQYALLVGLILAIQNSYAESTDTSTETAQENEDTIVVRSTPTSQSMGTQIITAEQIKQIPTRNGSITDLLRNNPNVQFANQTDSSNTPGEIEPDNVSFHGEKFYNNNYMIDGLSNNNVMNPGANNGIASNTPDGYSPDALPAGGAQSFWIGSELIDSVEVYDSNISAKYGDFTGGVVDAKLKDPDLERASGTVSFRTTRDEWTKYHIDDAIQESFESATALTYQPKFTKNFYSATINQPINDKAGLLFSYNRQESDIPYYHSDLDLWVDQKRIAETYLLKGIYLADNGDTFRATAMYAPHESKFYKDDMRDGAFTNEGGGYRFNLEWEHLNGWGKITSLIGYQYEQNHIEHESDNYYLWWRRNQGTWSNVIDWSSASASSVNQTALQGGYGEYETAKKTWTAKQDYQFNPLKWGKTSHQLDLGWQLDVSDARYKRYRDVTSNTATWNASTVCATDDDLCIDGEQYIATRILYPARTVDASYTNYAAYVQDSIHFGRLEVTPGLRMSVDNFLSNINVAPRLAMSYDVFGDHHSRLFGGANRYYAGNILAYKLRQGISERYTLRRTSATADWTTTKNSISYDYDVSKLDTPYSDELNFGIAQRIWDTIWTLKYVHREGKDQFARTTTTDESGQKYYVMDNSAHTEGNTVSLSIEPISPLKFKYADVMWSFGANYAKNKSSKNAYNTAAYDDSTSDESMVIFDGKLMQRGEMDALNFNTPWTAFFNITTHFPLIDLTWGQRFGYTAGYQGYSTSSVVCPSGNSACGDYSGSATLYTEKKYDDYFSYDWRFNYSKPLSGHQSLDVSLDITNVLDTTIETNQTLSSSSAITYKTGRQFWLGVSYNW